MQSSHLVGVRHLLLPAPRAQLHLPMLPAPGPRGGLREGEAEVLGPVALEEDVEVAGEIGVQVLFLFGGFVMRS